MAIKPLSDRVVLKALEKDNITDSGIYIPEGTAKEKPYIYEVIAVGPGKKDVEMTIKKGDKVLVGQYSGDDVKYNDEEYKIVGIDYILGVVE